MIRRGSGILIILATFALTSCALVPKESVELSTTVGRDISVARTAHKELANILYDRMTEDVNRFVDDVYAPYQIGVALKGQKKKRDSGNDENLLTALETALREPQNAQAQKDVLDMMQIVVELIREDVEDYRKIRLKPIDEQRKELLSRIELLYDQMERGNATVTAHLESVVKVHETQDEILKAADLEGFREKIGIDLSTASERIASFVTKAERVDGTLDGAAEEIRKLTSKLDGLTSASGPHDGEPQPIAGAGTQ